MKKTLLTLAALSLGAYATADVPPAPAQSPQAQGQYGPTAPQQQAPQVDQSEIQQLMAQLQELSQRIETVQQQARETAEVQEALVEYAKSLSEAMVEVNPEKKNDIQRFEKLMVEIIQLDDPDQMSERDQEKVRSTIQEHQQLSTELAAVHSQAIQSEKVQTMQEEARQTQMEIMQELEPQLMDIVRERGELVQRIQQLQGGAQQPRPMQGS